MNAKKELTMQPISIWSRSGAVAVGICFILLGAWLFFSPPERVSTTTSKTSASAPVAETEIATSAEPTAVVIMALTGGLIAILYGINGLRITKFAGGSVSVEAQYREATVPPESLIGTPESDVGTKPLVAPSSANRPLKTLAALIWNMMPPQYRPLVTPEQPGPLDARELKAGEKMVVDRIALTKSDEVFYFSHDIMLCFAALLCSANRGTIWHTANQAAGHLALMGFGGTPLQRQLEQIKTECDPAIKSDLTEDRRLQLAAEVFRLSRTVGQITEQLVRLPT